MTVNPFAFEARASDDEVKTDLELTCTECGLVICDIEHGDNIGTLLSVIGDHTCKTARERVPTFSLSVDGEYSGNAYPEHVEYEVKITAANDTDPICYGSITHSSGAVVGMFEIDEAAADGIDRMANTDHGLGGYEDDWKIPAGMDRRLSWTLPTDLPHYVVLNQDHIDNIATWLEYAFGEKTWDWDEQGEEYEY